MNRRLAGLGIGIGMAVALVGCGDETGNATVSYTIGISGTCDDAMIATVRLILEDGDGEVARQTSPCMDRGEISVKDVAVGSYIATLEGLNRDGVVTHRATDIDVSITAGGNATAMGRLTPIPATLRLAWSFPDGRMCNHPLVMVDSILVEAFDQNNAPVRFDRGTNEAACTDAFLILESQDFAAGNYDVLVTALRGSTQLFQHLMESVPLEPGTVTDRTAMLKPCEEQPTGACQ